MGDQFAQITRTRHNYKILATFWPGMINMLPNNHIEIKSITSCSYNVKELQAFLGYLGYWLIFMPYLF